MNDSTKRVYYTTGREPRVDRAVPIIIDDPIYLSKKDYRCLLEAVNGPPEPNEKLKELIRSPSPYVDYDAAMGRIFFWIQAVALTVMCTFALLKVFHVI